MGHCLERIRFFLHSKKAFDKFCIGNRIFYTTLLIVLIIVVFVAYFGFGGSSGRASNVIVISDSSVTDHATSSSIGTDSSTVIDTTISAILDVVNQTEVALTTNDMTTDFNDTTTDLNDTTIGTTVDILDPIV